MKRERGRHSQRESKKESEKERERHLDKDGEKERDIYRERKGMRERSIAVAGFKLRDKIPTPPSVSVYLDMDIRDQLTWRSLS